MYAISIHLILDDISTLFYKSYRNIENRPIINVRKIKFYCESFLPEFGYSYTVLDK